MVGSRQLVAEGIGTAFLVTAVVGSGIMGERLAGGNTAIALLANTLATAATLVALILVFGPISGAHFNPVVSMAAACGGGLSWSGAAALSATQVCGGVVGTGLAHAMFGEPLVQVSTHVRAGGTQLLSEVVATFGLLMVIRMCGRTRPDQVAYAVALYIAGAYWFTASTSFANPAVTIARTFTDTFAGIRPVDAVGFIAAQLAGGTAAVAFTHWLFAGTDTASIRATLQPSEE